MNAFPMTLSGLESKVEQLSKLVELLTVRVSELQDKQQMQQEAITRLSRMKANKPGAFWDEK